MKKAGAERISGKYPTKKDAVTNATRLVKAAGGGELIVHASDGRVVKRTPLGGDQPHASGSGHKSKSMALKK